MSDLVKNKKKSREFLRGSFLVGRGERIRTSDPQHPMLVRYQAALRPVNQRVGIMVDLPFNVKKKCRGRQTILRQKIELVRWFSPVMGGACR